MTMDTYRTRTCAVCGYTQGMQDPTNHSCASVLRETLRMTRDELKELRGQLQAQEHLHQDTLQELDTARRYGDVAYQRGFSGALRLALGRLARMPWARHFVVPRLKDLVDLHAVAIEHELHARHR